MAPTALLKKLAYVFWQDEFGNKYEIKANLTNF